MLACAEAGTHDTHNGQAGLHARAAKEAAAHIAEETTSGAKTVHDITTPDVKQRIADTTAALNADAAQKALEVSHCPSTVHLQASISPPLRKWDDDWSLHTDTASAPLHRACPCNLLMAGPCPR